MIIRRLYHKDIGLPALVVDQIRAMGDLHLSYSTHAMQACLNDRYGVISRPPMIVNPHALGAVEVEVRDGIVVKVVVRLSYDDIFDLVMAIAVDQGRAVVKTVWLNHRNDLHRTLDHSKYCKP